MCSHERTIVLDSRWVRGRRYRTKRCVDCCLRLRTIEIVLQGYADKEYRRSETVKAEARLTLIDSLSDEQCTGIVKLLGLEKEYEDG